ncbi:MAG: hypothetical protein ACYCW6_17335 [Candidatus Xenobia bacterium]
MKNIYDYTFALRQHRPGDRVQVRIRRGTQVLTLPAVLQARAPHP